MLFNMWIFVFIFVVNFMHEEMYHNTLSIPRKGQHTERTIYTVGWLLLFAAPPLMQLYDLLAGVDSSYEWGKVGLIWLTMLYYFICFELNDLVLLPKLLAEGKRVWYLLSVVALIAVFVAVTPVPPDPPLHTIPRHGPEPPPLSPSERVRMFNTVLLICMLLMNVAIKLYFRSIAETQRIKEMQSEQTRTQLETLRYQINPHFMMNTLNNIQALIDISPDSAKDAIQQLSRLMRYMLHDSSRPLVSLSKEIETLNHFIKLMRLRCPEEVEIVTHFPEHTDGVDVPPLLFISFVENAFKYGVDYDNPSAISVTIDVNDDKVKFLCLNNINHAAQAKKGGGTGIANVAKRLDLLYRNDHLLDIKDNGKTFSVTMEFPITPITAKS